MIPSNYSAATSINMTATKNAAVTYASNNYLVAISPVVGFVAGLMLVSKIDERKIKNAEKVRVTDK